VLFLAVRHALEAALDEECREVLAFVVDDLAEHDVEIGEAAVCDPGLLAVQHEAAVRLADGARFRTERVRSGSRLAQAVAPTRSPVSRRGR
jgi:hypothetical protein